MAPDMFSGWGVRTLSSAHPAYNPFSYHLGSVWPVENGTFALGLARHGCFEEFHRLAEGVFALSDLFVANRLPEAIGGHTRDEMHPHPGIYPRSNELQGWSASAIILFIQMFLGMMPLAPLNLLLVYPNLPAWLPDLRVSGIRVGQSIVDIQAWRAKDGQTRYQVMRQEGPIRVVLQPPPDALTTWPGSRAVAVLKSFGRRGSIKDRGVTPPA